ncbi:MAG: acylneuraminate cytidylyltransferase family protein, partial [Dissulfurispiraceae bacterium]
PEFNVVLDGPDGFIRKMNGSADFRVLRRQELKDVYFFDGTLYMSDIPTLLSKRTFYHELTLSYIVPHWKSVEIDDLSDFICCEALMKARAEGLL